LFAQFLEIIHHGINFVVITANFIISTFGVWKYHSFEYKRRFFNVADKPDYNEILCFFEIFVL